MKIDVRLKGWKSDARIRRFVQEQLECLPNFGFVSDAQVVLVRARQGGPAWTASAPQHTCSFGTTTSTPLRWRTRTVASCVGP